MLHRANLRQQPMEATYLDLLQTWGYVRAHHMQQGLQAIRLLHGQEISRRAQLRMPRSHCTLYTAGHLGGFETRSNYDAPRWKWVWESCESNIKKIWCTPSHKTELHFNAAHPLRIWLELLDLGVCFVVAFAVRWVLCSERRPRLRTP